MQYSYQVDFFIINTPLPTYFNHYYTYKFSFKSFDFFICLFQLTIQSFTGFLKVWKMNTTLANR